jgi:hypothetical protein
MIREWCAIFLYGLYKLAFSLTQQKCKSKEQQEQYDHIQCS